MIKKFVLGLVLPLMFFASCDVDGTKEAAEAGRQYAIKEYELATTKPTDPNYSRLDQELDALRKADRAKYGKDSKAWKAYEDARMETNRSLYK